MKTHAISVIFATLFAAQAAYANEDGESLLWYGGDTVYPVGQIKNTMKNVTYLGNSVLIGDSVLDDFIVPDATGWHVTGLFSNNIADYPIDTAPFTQAAWSIRTGVAGGNPGNILFAGINPVTVTPTGRTFNGDVEYTVTVSGLSLDLVPGVYFMNVSPLAQEQIYYLADSDGTNAVGSAGPSDILQEERSIEDGELKYNIMVYNNIPRVSMGVIGIKIVPMPTSKDQCKNGGWKAFGFKNEGQCIQFVNISM